MIDIELAPEVMFIPPEVWNNDFGRDTALGLLLDYLDEIEKLRVVSILWSDQMEELLWRDPTMPPWRMDRDWNLKLVPIIATKFRRALKHLDVSIECEELGFMPPGTLKCVREDITRAFCCLSHQAALDADELILCLGKPLLTQAPVSFQCGKCALDLTVRPVESPAGLARDREIATELWSSAEVKCSADLDYLLGLVLRWQSGGANALYRASYSRSFVKGVGSAGNKRAIVEAIAKRIVMTEEEARHDHGLHDEPVRGREKEGVRRFRVSIAERIHYDYPTSGEIRFVDHFPEGHHDDGL